MNAKNFKIFGIMMVFLLLASSACSPLAVEPAQPTSEAIVTPDTPAQPTEESLPPTVEPMTEEIVLASNVLRENEPKIEGADLETLAAGNTAFSMELYQLLNDKEGNLFYSPYSISLALAMTYAGARGETESQMADTLHFSLDQSRLHPAFNALDQQLRTSPAGEDASFRLNIANSLWGQRDYPFREDFLDTLARNYGAGMFIVDYNQPENARALINDWVADNTEDKIQDLIPGGALTPMTRLVLANAIYFKAAWQSQFQVEATQPGDFILLDGSLIQTPMMNQSIMLSYSKGEDYQAVELPYENSSISMLILLPDEGKLQTIDENLSADMVQEILGEMQMTQVDLSLPKFKIESEFDLAKTLQTMGMADAFDPSTADFTGMVDAQELFISDVVHKAYVNVNEEGTEAAAATAVIMKVTSMPAESIVFKVDRPFVFMIIDRASNTVLFVGRVVNPGSN